MTNEIIVSFIKPYHQYIQRETFLSKGIYDKFLNWISGEFDLYLQDENNDLNIFLPNGILVIKKLDTIKSKVVVEISFQTKNLNAGEVVMSTVNSINRRLNTICN